MLETLNEALREEANELLKFDPLATAEKLTGKNYEHSSETSALGMALMWKVSEKKENLLTMLKDTHFNTTFAEFQDIATKAGFNLVYQEDVPDPEQKNVFQIWWNENKSILLKVESYWGKSEADRGKINSGEMFYNWKPNNEQNTHQYISSGGFYNPQNPKGRIPSTAKFEDLVWVGHHDIREGMNGNIEALEKNGTFVKQWIKFPFVWLLNYMESKPKGYDYEAINAKKIKMLPKNIQKAICFELDN